MFTNLNIYSFTTLTRDALLVKRQADGQQQAHSSRCSLLGASACLRAKPAHISSGHLLGGYQIHTSKLATPEALERLLLIVAIAILHLTSIGAGVFRAGKHRWVDTHWDRGMSYLKLGRRWRQQQYQRGWQAFVPFWLDPAPDPLPVPASRRAVLGGKKGVDLPTAV